ncbi:replication initiation protein, partial [Streptomyces sioyaensis]
TRVIAHWAYAGHGHTPGESWLAANLAKEIQANRQIAREVRAELEAEEGDDWS